MSRKLFITKNASEEFEEFTGTEKNFLKIKDFWGKKWEFNGEIHRDNGPALIFASGSEFWYQNGLFDREDGPACILHDGAYKTWHKNGLRHRTDGPAVVLTEEMKYYVGWKPGIPWIGEYWYFQDVDLSTVFPFCNFESKYNNFE